MLPSGSDTINPSGARHSLIEHAVGENVDIGRIVRRHAVPCAGKERVPFRTGTLRQNGSPIGQGGRLDERGVPLRCGGERIVLHEIPEIALDELDHERAVSRKRRGGILVPAGKLRRGEALGEIRVEIAPERITVAEKRAGPDAAFGRDRHAVGVIGVRGERKTGGICEILLQFFARGIEHFVKVAAVGVSGGYGAGKIIALAAESSEQCVSGERRALRVPVAVRFEIERLGFL